MARKPAILEDEGGNYFATPSSDIQFISSGCQVLDCVLGGGYPLGRIVNIVGDKSTGKTLLAIEACANFAHTYESGNIWYNEVEAAFDLKYAGALGLPLDRVKFIDGNFTVEDFFEHIESVIKEYKGLSSPGLYILDSLDALSDRAELNRGMDEGTYGAEKAKKLGQLLRRCNKKLSGCNVCLIIISQVRDNIGVAFGEKHSRSGGRSLDFYASQVIYLRHTKKHTKTRKGITRPVGVQIKVQCKKNKVGLPFRECEFPIMFGYGVDDITASVEWLQSVKRLEDFTQMSSEAYLKSILKMDDEEFFAQSKLAADVVKKVWSEIETSFLPTRKKYV